MASSRPTVDPLVPRIRPVILSGGSGTRLWPLSRELYPKQLLALASQNSLIHDTLIRVADSDRFDPPIVVCNDQHRFIVAEQVRQIEEIDASACSMILEPTGRNTAPAVALAANFATRTQPDALLLVLPSDHAIRDVDAFGNALVKAHAAASDGALLTFGIRPDRPETGYGYIKQGDQLDGRDGVYRVESFVEKPDTETAEEFVSSGDHAWNSGMFLFRADVFLEELSRLQPEMADACSAAVKKGYSDLDFFRPEATAFEASPAESIDIAIMERTDKAVVVPVDIGWSDIGSWTTLWELGAKDRSGNVIAGDVLIEDVRDSFIRSDRQLTAAIGLRDIIIVVTDDAVLAVDRNDAQKVRLIVDRLVKGGREEATTHRKVYRPWGDYESIDAGARYQVKRITVKPGASLSLQKHKHRAEHWVVVSGKARVTRDKDVFDLSVNESTFIPAGAVHRLENPGDQPLELIEVQSGDYLGEDDIVRLDDVYGRQTKTAEN